LAPRAAQTEERPKRRLWLAAAVALTAGGFLAGHSLMPAQATTPPPPSRPTLTPTPSRAPAARPTLVPVPKAGTFAQAGARPPIKLDVPSLDGSWPLGLFVLEVKEAPSKQPGKKAVSVELGVVNEAGQTLTIAAAAQYKEAVSLFTGGRWKGLFYAGFRTAGDQDLLPGGGGGAADLPPGVWGQIHLDVDLPPEDSVRYLRLGSTSRDAMIAHELASARLKPDGQPWAAAGAAPTPVSVSTEPAQTVP
jgi:hypothetical protein